MNEHKTQTDLLEELIENSSLGYHSLDSNGIIINVNDIWLGTLGYDKKDVIGQHLIGFIHPDFRDKFTNNFPKLIEIGAIKDLTFRMLHSDGHAVELVFNGTAIRDDDGNFTRTVASFHRPTAVVSESNQSEDEHGLISQSRAELMREMMTAVAHQWRQPLNALGLIVQDTYELAQIAGMTSPEIKENTDTAMNLVLKMSGIIDEFREFFISSEQNTKLNTVKVVMQCLRALISQLQEYDIDFSVICECAKDHFSVVNETAEPSCPAHYSDIFANENELKQVLINVISNARYAMVQAMDRGLITKGSLRIHVLNQDGHVDIIVTNNGMHIPKDIIDKVFDPYFSTKKEGEGLGLGLYFSKILVENRMRGSISINNMSEGVQVKITLPIMSKQLD